MRQLGGGRSRFRAHAAQEKIGQITDQTVDVAAKGQRIAEKSPQNRNDAQRGVTVHVRGKHIAGANQPPVKQRQRRSHEHDHGGAQQYKGSVGDVHNLLLVDTGGDSAAPERPRWSNKHTYAASFQ